VSFLQSPPDSPWKIFVQMSKQKMCPEPSVCQKPPLIRGEECSLKRRDTVCPGCGGPLSRLLIGQRECKNPKCDVIKVYWRLKKEVLELLLKKGKGRAPTSKDVASTLGITKTNSSDCLGRLKKQSLVDRRILNVRHRGRPKYEYSINARGRNRLKFYASNPKESFEIV